jgi:AcrR family transcriptional regulator
MEKKPKRTNKSAKKKADIYNHIIDTALYLAAEKGWQDLLLNDIAKKADITLADLYTNFPNKIAILNGFQRRTNDSILRTGIEEGSSSRDQLFGILMCRFDVLQTYRESIRVILRDVAFEPLTAITQFPELYSSMASMLEVAGISSSGIGGALRVKGLILVYLRALRIWLNDDSTDLSETMASLDRDLARAESLLGMLNQSKMSKN